MIDTKRKTLQDFLDQLHVAYEKNLIFALSVNYPHITITFHKETEGLVVDKVVDAIRKNYEKIEKIRVECHRHGPSRHYHYVLNITLSVNAP